MRPDELERRLRDRLNALGPASRAELLHVLMLPDFERADRIGEFWGHPKTRTFGELLIDARRTGSYGRYSSACCGRPPGLVSVAVRTESPAPPASWRSGQCGAKLATLLLPPTQPARDLSR
jgi:hypothetical protein